MNTNNPEIPAGVELGAAEEITPETHAELNNGKGDDDDE